MKLKEKYIKFVFKFINKNTFTIYLHKDLFENDHYAMQKTNMLSKKNKRQFSYLFHTILTLLLISVKS